MKKMSSKIIAAIIIIAIVAIAIGLGNKYIYGPAIKGSKTLTITIEDQMNNKVIMNKEVFHTDAKTLDQFMQENKIELNAEIKQEYGMPFLLGLKGLKTTDMKTGPWWMYGFTDKAAKLDYKVGAAPAMDKVMLGKDSTVTFAFTNKY